MNFALVQQGVQHALALLEPVTQVLNVSTSVAERCISWQGRLPGIQKGVYYPIEYQYLLDRQQYSLLLRDGSFIQIYYQFKEDGKLKSARLALYPKPIATTDLPDDLYDAAESALEREDDELYEHLFNWAEYLEERRGSPVNTSHIRMDYDDEVESHAKSHLQFGALQEFRIPADFYPQPLAFVELCLKLTDGLEPLNASHLAFARNNLLATERTAAIICLNALAAP